MATVLKGGTLIDGTGAAPLPRSVVVMEGERIARVGAEADFGSSWPAWEKCWTFRERPCCQA